MESVRNIGKEYYRIVIVSTLLIETLFIDTTTQSFTK